MRTEEGRQTVYAFGGWEIDLARRELRSMGVPVQLGGRAFEIIAELVKSAGELVTKDDVMNRVWPGVIVEENALQVHIAAIRKALGPDRRMLETAFGRGYRLLGSWEIQQETPVPTPSAHDPKRTSAKRFATNLPAAAFELIGRTSAIEHLQELLSAYRLVTLVGPGGIGKSALAVEVARTVLPNFRGDVFLAELSSLADPLLMPVQVARALGLRLHGNDTSPDSVAHAIGERKLLIILDNCEHLVDASAKLAETIIGQCPGCIVLATSREVLRVSGEYVYRVPPLDVPPPDDVGHNDALKHAAVQLFVARAKALGTDLTADEDNLGSIATICRRLDGIPLALELAAARAAVLGPREVDALLDDRFGILTSGRRTALPRHQTLRMTLDWSFNLLPVAEAGLLLRLAIFAGQFPMEGAVAIAGDVATPLVTDHIANLVAKSLLVAELRQRKPHYRLLDTTRAYALEKLRATGEFGQTAQCLAKYCLASLERSQAESSSMTQADWLAKYGHLIDNVRASLDWALGPDGDPDIGIALTTAALPLWAQLSLLTECRERAERALTRLTDGTDIAQRQRMQLSAALGWSLMYGVGRAREAGRIWAATLELADLLDDKEHRLRALWGLCIDQFNNGDFLKALEFAHRFDDETRYSTDPVDPMMADRLLATTLHYMGDQKGARHHIDRVLAGLAVAFKPQIIRFQFDLRVSTHYFQARILWLQGVADQALQVIEHNIEEGRALGHAMTFCSVLGQAACTISFLAGDFDAAERYCAALLEHTKRYPIRPWQLWARCFEGLLMSRRGNIAAGVGTMRRELESAGEARFLPRFSLLTGEFAASLGESGEVAEGLATVDEILTRSIARKEQWYVSELLRIKGELLLRERPRSSTAAAEYCFDESLELAQRQGALFWELRSALSMARQKVEKGQKEVARQLLVPVYEKFIGGSEFADLRAAREVLASLS